MRYFLPALPRSLEDHVQPEFLTRPPLGRILGAVGAHVPHNVVRVPGTWWGVRGLDCVAAIWKLRLAMQL